MPSLEACVLSSYHAREVVFAVDGRQVVGAEFGSGSVGVVMAHEFMANLCGWVAYAEHLSTLGYRALAFDFGGELVDDVAGAAEQVVHDGASRVVLMGASMGGTASLVAAQTYPAHVVAVASLSGPANYLGIDALAAVRHLTIPVLFMVAQQDYAFSADASTLYDACASPHKYLQVYPGNDHGTELLGFSVAAAAQSRLDAFLAAVSQ